MNGDSNSTIIGRPNNNIVLSNNYSGCNINRSINHLVSNGIPVNQQVLN